jgi:hypothetical protein
MYPAPIPQPPRAMQENPPEQKDEKSSRSPHRKVAAGGAGGGVAGLLSVLLAYYFPDMPATVTAAHASLLVLILSFAVAYLTKAEADV